MKKNFELIFDGTYLSLTLILSLVLFTINPLWAIMGLVLVIGDSFHLIPRMLSIYANNNNYQTAIGYGKLVTSITMSCFYVLLFENGLKIFNLSSPILSTIMYVICLIRIILCLLPSNKWANGGIGGKISIFRNIPLTLQGLLVIFIYAKYYYNLSLYLVWIMVVISFICYIPVVLWVEKKPILGMLMLPKTLAYFIIVLLGIFI